MVLYVVGVLSKSDGFVVRNEELVKTENSVRS